MKHKRTRQSQRAIKKANKSGASGKRAAKRSGAGRMSKRTKLTIFFISLIVLIAGFIVFMEFGSFFGNLNGVPENTVPADQALMPIDPETGKINVLAVGLDKGGYRTDTIIIASWDLDENKVNILSVPRDTRMYVGGHYQKINCAYAIKENGKMKGISGTIDAVMRLTGIPIHHYVIFECDTFREVIDAIGGVDFDIPQNMNYDDPAQDLHIHLRKGQQHLDGDKAEQLVRFRRYPTGDIKRVEVQQDFMRALAEQKLNKSIVGKLPELYKVWKDNIKMSFKADDIVRYSGSLLKLDSENIKAYSVPGVADGVSYGASYWIADMDELKTLIEETFGYDASQITIHSKDGKSASKDTKKTTAQTDTKKTNTGTQQDTEKTKTDTVKDTSSKTTEKDNSKTTEKDKEDKGASTSETKKTDKKDESEEGKTKEDTGGPKRPVANDEDDE